MASTDARKQPSVEHNEPREAFATCASPLATSQASLAESSGTIGHYGLSRWAFFCCWLLVLTIHALCATFYILIAMMYHYLQSTSVIWDIVMYSLSIDIIAYPVIVVTHALLATAHAFALAKMLYQSLHVGYLTLDLPSRSENASNTENISSATLQRTSLRGRVDSLLQRVSRCLRHRCRWLGPEVAFTELRMALRVTIDIILLTIQCYRLSWYLSRMWLQRWYVVMLVVNCWTNPVLEVVIHRAQTSRHLLRTRAVVDTSIDLISVVVIPCVLLHTYSAHYDWTRRDFSRPFYYDDQLLLQFLNEFKLLLVYSVPDLLQRLLLGTDLLLCLQTIKSLVRPAMPRSSIQPTMSVPIASSSPQKHVITIAVAPIQQRGGADDAGPSKTSEPRARIHVATTMTKTIHALLVVWGLVVACAQLYTEIRPVPDDCVITVRPWFRRKPGCALLEVSGESVSAEQATKDSIVKRLAAFDEEAVSYLILSHHTALTVPPNIQQLRNLVGLKMKNVTVIEWNEAAALTQTHHPRASFVFLVQFNTSSIPAGLLSSDFPELLLDIEICVSTMSNVPSNLPSVWPAGMWLFIDHSNFTTIPDVLVDMDLAYLSLGFNRIETVPAALFTNPSLTLVALQGNPISVLPEVPAENRTALDLLILDSTNLSVLPSWMDASFLVSTKVVLGNTPYCDGLGAANQTAETTHHQLLCRKNDDCRRLHKIA